MVKALACDWRGRKFNSRPFRCQVTTLCKHMGHRLEWFIHLRAQGLSKGDEHLANTAGGVWYS